MLMTVAQCMEQMELLDDTHELISRLLELAERQRPTDAYYLREAATNMEALYGLSRSMAARLQQTHDTTVPPPSTAADGPMPTPTSAQPKTESNAQDLLDLASVLKLASVGRTSWLHAVKSGAAPNPIRLGRRTFWLREDVTGWIASKVAARSEGGS